jgi:hypothetical protein
LHVPPESVGISRLRAAPRLRCRSRAGCEKHQLE